MRSGVCSYYARLTEANLELLEGLHWLSTEGLDNYEDYKKVNPQFLRLYERSIGGH